MWLSQSWLPFYSVYKEDLVEILFFLAAFFLAENIESCVFAFTVFLSRRHTNNLFELLLSPLDTICTFCLCFVLSASTFGSHERPAHRDGCRNPFLLVSSCSVPFLLVVA